MINVTSMCWNCCLSDAQALDLGLFVLFISMYLGSRPLSEFKYWENIWNSLYLRLQRREFLRPPNAGFTVLPLDSIALTLVATKWGQSWFSLKILPVVLFLSRLTFFQIYSADKTVWSFTQYSWLSSGLLDGFLIKVNTFRFYLGLRSCT